MLSRVTIRQPHDVNKEGIKRLEIPMTLNPEKIKSADIQQILKSEQLILKLWLNINWTQNVISAKYYCKLINNHDNNFINWKKTKW